MGAVTDSIRLILIALTAGCGATAPALNDAPAPAWAAHPPSGTYIGKACTAQEPVKAARAEALAELANQLGVRVESVLDMTDTEGAAGSTSEVRASIRLCGKPVTVRAAKVTRQATSSGCTWVRVAVPAKELARLKRQALGKTALSLTCQEGTTVRACPPGLEGSVRQAATKAGLRLTPTLVPSGDLNAARGANAAHLLAVTVRPRLEAEQDGEFYAYATAGLQLVDTADEKVLAAINVGEDGNKGGAYSREGAIKAAGNKAAEKLTKRLATGQELSPARTGETTCAKQ